MYEEFIDICTEFLDDFLPIHLSELHDKQDRSIALYKQHQKVSIIIDDCDHSGTIHGYNKSLCIIKKFKVSDLPENVKEKIEYLLRYKQKFSLDELK